MLVFLGEPKSSSFFWRRDLIQRKAPLEIENMYGGTVALLAAAVAFTAAERRRMVAAVAVILFVVGGWAQTNLFLPYYGSSIPLAWWLITIGMALVMFMTARPRAVPALLVLTATLFGATHVPPRGPLGMLCLLGAAVFGPRAEQQRDSEMRNNP